MPWYHPGGGVWISIVLGLVLIVIVVFAFYQMNKTLSELKLELSNLRNALEETKRYTEDVIEEV